MSSQFCFPIIIDVTSDVQRRSLRFSTSTQIFNTLCMRNLINFSISSRDCHFAERIPNLGVLRCGGVTRCQHLVNPSTHCSQTLFECACVHLWCSQLLPDSVSPGSTSHGFRYRSSCCSYQNAIASCHSQCYPIRKWICDTPTPFSVVYFCLI